MTYRDKRWTLAVIGALALAVGVLAAFLGPVEMYCFYLFSEGGPFHYEGFGFGSFMFGNIAAQIIGYYVLAALFIPLGYGHLTLRPWARTLALTLLWSWIVVGAPLSVVFLFVLFTAKDLSLAVALIAIALMGLGYLVLPWALIRFYSSRNVRLTFETRAPNSNWLDRRPLPILVLSFLYALYVVCLHVPIFFRGLFPFFGTFWFDLQGIVGLTVSMLILALLAWGTLRQRRWAWWGALAYFGLMTASTLLTLVRADTVEILSHLHFPPTEIKALQGLPFQGSHFALLIGPPLAMTWGAIVLSKRHFGFGRPHQATLHNPLAEPERQ